MDEGRPLRTRPPPPAPMDPPQNRGELYRKTLKARLRAAIPRSMRKTAFRLAGMDAPAVQLDSQKLRELEKLEAWLKTLFPAEMECDPVCVPRDRLKAHLDKLDRAAGAPAGAPPTPAVVMRYATVKPEPGKTAAALKPPKIPPSGSKLVRGPSGTRAPPGTQQPRQATAADDSDEAETEEDDPTKRLTRKRVAAPSRAGGLDRGGFGMGLEQLTRAASLTDPMSVLLTPGSLVTGHPPSKRAPAILYHGRDDDTPLQRHPSSAYDSNLYTPLSQSSLPGGLSQELSQFSVLDDPAGGLYGGSSADPGVPPPPPSRGGSGVYGDIQLTRAHTDIFAPMSFRASQELGLLDQFGVGHTNTRPTPARPHPPKPSSKPPPPPPDPYSLESVPFDDVLFGDDSLVPKVPLPALADEQLLGMPTHHAKYKDSPTLSSWAAISALFRSNSGRFDVCGASPGAVAASSVKAEVAPGLNQQLSERNSPEDLFALLSPLAFDRMFSMSTPATGDAFMDAELEMCTKASRNWMLVFSSNPLVDPSVGSGALSSQEPLPSLHDATSIADVPFAFLDSISGCTGALTAEFVCGRHSTLSTVSRQAPFSILHLFVNASSDGATLLFETDSFGVDPVPTASVLGPGQLPPVVVICGTNALAAAAEASKRFQVAIGLELQPQGGSADASPINVPLQALREMYQSLLHGSCISDGFMVLQRAVVGACAMFAPSSATVRPLVAVEGENFPVVVGRALPRLRFSPWALGLDGMDPPVALHGRRLALHGLLAGLSNACTSGGSPGRRVLALDGPLGVGKSTLALHAAVQASCRGLFPDGVAWVNPVLPPSASMPKAKPAQPHSHNATDAMCRAIASQLGLAWGSSAGRPVAFGRTTEPFSQAVTTLSQSLHGSAVLVVFDCVESDPVSVANIANALVQYTQRVVVLLTNVCPGVNGDQVVVAVPPLEPLSALELFRECMPSLGDGSVPTTTAEDPPLPKRKRARSPDDTAVGVAASIVGACGHLPGNIVHLARIVTSGACDYDALLQHLRGTAADTVHELAAVLVVTSLSAVTDTSLLRVAHVACHLHGEFTLEDVAEVGGMPEPVVGDALELLHRKWRVLHRNYRNGHVYSVVPTFVKALKAHISPGTIDDMERCLIACMSPSGDRVSEFGLYVSLTGCAPVTDTPISTMELMARASVRCYEAVRMLHLGLVRQDGQIASEVVSEFRGMLPTVQHLVDWLHTQVLATRSYIAAALSLLIVSTAAPMFHYTLPASQQLDIFDKQCQVCDAGILATGSGARGPSSPLQSPSRPRSSQKMTWLMTTLGPMVAWLNSRMRLLLARTRLGATNLSEVKAMLYDLSMQLGLPLPQATLARPLIPGHPAPPKVPPSGSSQGMAEDDVALLLAFAESENLSQSDDAGGPSGRDLTSLCRDEQSLLVAINKAELLLVHAGVMVALLNERQVALTCYQMVVGLLEFVCPLDGRPSGFGSVVCRPGCRPVHVVTAATLLSTALAGLGQAFGSQGLSDQALQSYRNALTIRASYLGELHPLTGVALHELACCFIDANRPSDALPLLRRGYDVLLQAVDNTGPFEGQTGIALASLLFTLARCCQLLLVDSVGAAGTSTALRTVPPEETKMIATVEHALTVCLYLEVTLLGVHPDTMNTYSELGQWFSGQRRPRRAFACFSKAHEYATVLLEGHNSACLCPHVDVGTHGLDAADELVRMGDFPEAERWYTSVLECRQLRLGCKSNHFDVVDNPERMVYEAMVALARVQRLAGTVDQLNKSYATQELVFAGVRPEADLELYLQAVLERGRFHLAAHAAPAGVVGLACVVPSEYTAAFPHAATAMHMFMEVLGVQPDGSVDLHPEDDENADIRALYNKCRVGLGSSYRVIAQAKRRANPKADTLPEFTAAQRWYSTALDYTMSVWSRSTHMEKSSALAGYATFLYEFDQFQPALSHFADALAYMPCYDEHHLALARIEITMGLCHAKAASRARVSGGSVTTPYASVGWSQSSPCASVSSTAATSVSREVKRAKCRFRRALLHALPHRHALPDSVMDEEREDGELAPLWFEGPCTAVALAGPWLVQVSPGVPVSALTDACLMAFEAHRGLRNTGAVELELGPEEQHLDELTVYVDASKAVADSLVAALGCPEAAAMHARQALLADVQEGLTLCEKLVRRARDGPKPKP